MSNTNHVPVNIKHTDTGYELEFALPGLSKDDVSITFENNLLEVAFEAETEQDNAHYKVKEFGIASFKRSFKLPKTVDDEKIEATFENGILKLALPKKEEALPKPKKLIEIS